MEATSDVQWFAPDGTPLPSPEGASAAEITEYLDGVPVRRTYGTLDPAVADVSIEAPDFVCESEDWLKSSWDLWADQARRDGTVEYRPVDTLDGLFTSRGLHHLTPAEQRTAVCHLLELPVWDAAPETLKGEVYEWLRSQTSRVAENSVPSPDDREDVCEVDDAP